MDSENERVLVGCLGEAAGRLMASLRGAQVETVGLFTEAEADAPYVDDSDYPVLLMVKPGEVPFENSARVLACAMDAGVDSYHPGVQRPSLELAHLLSSSGVVWLGPRRELLKLSDEDIATNAKEIGISVLPCTAQLAGAELRGAAERMGPPLVLRQKEQPARCLLHAKDISALTMEGRVERAVVGGLSIVVPVVGDGAGSAVSLPEIQSLRRDGKLLGRECPASGLSEECRQRIGEDAASLVAAMRWGGVVGVAFLVSADGRPWFRTLIRGLPEGWWLCDVVVGVELALAAASLARGEELGWSQDEVTIEKVALQLCLNATGEGVLERLSFPESADVVALRGEGAELQEGTAIAGFRVEARTHNAALVKAKVLLDAVEVEGVPTNLDALRQMVVEPGFWGPRLLGGG